MYNQGSRGILWCVISLSLFGCQEYRVNDELRFVREHDFKRNMISDSNFDPDDLKGHTLLTQARELPDKGARQPRERSISRSYISSRDDQPPTGIQCIQGAYSSEFEEGRRNGRTGALVFKNGASIRWDDKSSLHLHHPITEDEWRSLEPNPWRTHSHHQMLNRESLLAMMYQRYPTQHDLPRSIAKNFEPGRLRHEGFFKVVYGDSARRVSSQLRTMNWFEKEIRIHEKAYQSLERIRGEMESLPQRFHKFFRESSGTYYWRYIKGTERLSMHSFGVAIDIAVRHAHYWKWTLKVKRLKAKDGIPYQNHFPMEVVEIFEKNGWK